MGEFFKKLDKFLNSGPMLWVSGLCLAVSFIGEYILPFFNETGEPFELMVNFAWASVVISGIPLAYLAITRVIYQKFVSSALLITIAMVAAIYINDIFAAGEVAFIMAIGAWLEEKTVQRTRRGIEALLNLVPAQGRRIVVNSDGSVSEEMVKAEDLKIGDIFRVFPGESFPSDGEIVEGTTSVDQAIMTGESLPVDKTEGDEIFSGTINRFGSVDVKVTKAFSDSTLQKMIKLVNDADKRKAPMQKLADKWAAWLVPVACGIAVAAYFMTRYLFNLDLDALMLTHGLDTAAAALHQESLVRAVTVLVVFCPCALALATPTAVVAAIGQATKYGVLIKSGEALERMGKINTIAFDKTGTLTHGNLVVSDIVAFGVKEDELMSLAGSVEGRSEHPLGKAILRSAKEKSAQIKEVVDFEMTVGKGVVGYVDGRKVICGNEKLVEANSSAKISDAVVKTLDTLRSQGKAVIIVADDKAVIGVLAMSDTIKENSPEAIRLLKGAGITKSVLLTGDNVKTANYVANQVGLTDIKASLLPEGKVEALQQLVDENEHVCMVGDGVNDAPALKLASVGIAMGSMGSDIAIDAADIALMGDDITKISYIKKLSNGMVSSIKFNIMLSLAINIVAIYFSVSGLLVPTTAALVHNAGSVLVVINAGRLYEKKFI